MKRWPFFLLALLPGGCPLPESAAPTGDTTYDGQWQLRATAGQPPACTTIENGRFVRFDQGCSGTLRTVVDVQGVQGSGSSVRWTITLLIDGVVETVTLTGTVQADGSISGNLSGTIGTQPISSTFTMTRQ